MAYLSDGIEAIRELEDGLLFGVLSVGVFGGSDTVEVVDDDDGRLQRHRLVEGLFDLQLALIDDRREQFDG